MPPNTTIQRRYGCMLCPGAAKCLTRTSVLVIQMSRWLSFEVATILARFPLLDTLTYMNARIYDQIHVSIRLVKVYPVFSSALEALKRQEHQNEIQIQTKIITGHGCFSE